MLLLDVVIIRNCNTHTYIHTYMHTYTHTYTHIDTHTLVHTNTYIHTYTQIDIHAYTNIHINSVILIRIYSMEITEAIPKRSYAQMHLAFQAECSGFSYATSIFASFS